ncbi:MAG: exodeoxyribonuclease VII large subunit, partial [Robiginitomaculum sp.]
MSDPSPSNAHEFTVSELAGALKRTVEDNYGHVRVRGELGRVVIARSGHVYMDLKDDRAVISSIIWKGVASRLRFAPEEGLEVIAEGRLSTYPGRSQYQLIIESMEPAGAGALMALLEE